MVSSNKLSAVEVEVCPRCGGEMRIVAFVTERRVIRTILAHLDGRGCDAEARETLRRARALPIVAMASSPNLHEDEAG